MTELNTNKDWGRVHSPLTKYVTNSILSNRETRESHQVFDESVVKHYQKKKNKIRDIAKVKSQYLYALPEFSSCHYPLLCSMFGFVFITEKKKNFK